jgi:signal transduction histidine kinase
MVSMTDERHPQYAAAAPVRIVHVEDNAFDAELLSEVLQRDGLPCDIAVVDTEASFRDALAAPDVDLVISDYSIPSFNGLAALKISRSVRPELPFIFVSGTIGEERAIEALKQGATDYVLKERPARLVPAITRALAERAAEETLRRQAAALAQAEKLAAMGSLLAGVAHELNNPLATIIGHTELLARVMEGAAAERARKVSAAAERCARIVKNFLALARQRPPERQWVHLARVVAEALEIVGYSLTSSGVELTTDVDADLPILWADPHQLHQVVVNLVANAQQALRDREADRRISIRLGRRDAETVYLEVSDNGPGIPAAIVSRIFEPFFTTKAEGEGTGLGLSLCRGIVESHGGAIRLHTEAGLGTVFRIDLPVSRAPGAATSPASTPDSATVGARVLVIDDEKDLAVMIAEMLGEQGHQADVVTYGQQALERVATRLYDVILCDLRMPGMDGPTLYAAVQKQSPGQERRFAFLTGDTFSPGSATFLERTGAPSLSKPFTMDEVIRLVDDVRRANPPEPRG